MIVLLAHCIVKILLSNTQIPCNLSSTHFLIENWFDKKNMDRLLCQILLKLCNISIALIYVT